MPLVGLIRVKGVMIRLGNYACLPKEYHGQSFLLLLIVLRLKVYSARRRLHEPVVVWECFRNMSIIQEGVCAMRYEFLPCVDGSVLLMGFEVCVCVCVRVRVLACA